RITSRRLPERSTAHRASSSPGRDAVNQISRPSALQHGTPLALAQPRDNVFFDFPDLSITLIAKAPAASSQKAIEDPSRERRSVLTPSGTRTFPTGNSRRVFPSTTCATASSWPSGEKSAPAY